MVNDTRGPEYAARLQALQNRSWKKRWSALNPYRWHIRRITDGKVLDIGCGAGRCLAFIPDRSVGVDHNERLVEICRNSGLRAYTPGDFRKRFALSDSKFDTVLLSHVLEHMDVQQARDLIETYLPFCRDGCNLILITPQEVGFLSDTTHVEFMDFDKLSQIGSALGFEEIRHYSYPFIRPVGKLFVYNEFVYIGRRGNHQGDDSLRPVV